MTTSVLKFSSAREIDGTSVIVRFEGRDTHTLHLARGGDVAHEAARLRAHAIGYFGAVNPSWMEARVARAVALMGDEAVEVRDVHDVYAGELVGVFESTTGLRTSL